MNLRVTSFFLLFFDFFFFLKKIPLGAHGKKANIEHELKGGIIYACLMWHSGLVEVMEQIPAVVG